MSVRITAESSRNKLLEINQKQNGKNIATMGDDTSLSVSSFRMGGGDNVKMEVNPHLGNPILLARKKFKAYDYKQLLYGQYSIRIHKDTWIAGIPCSSDYRLVFYSNHKLAEATLSRSKKIKGRTWPAGARVYFNSKGKFEAVANVPNIIVKGVEYYTTSKEINYYLDSNAPLTIGPKRFCFHSNGKLESAYLVKSTTIQGVPCWSGEPVYFHNNGKLKQAHLKESKEIKGIPCWAEECVEFHRNGRLSFAVLSRSIKIKGIPCMGGERVGFHSNGRLSFATLSRSKKIKGIWYKAGTMIRFDKNGKVKK